MSGHHAQIARWRREQQLAITARRRPELIEAARAGRGELSKQDEHFFCLIAAIICGFPILYPAEFIPRGAGMIT